MIRGRVFVDRNDDGEYGPGDVGLTGVPVQLWEANAPTQNLLRRFVQSLPSKTQTTGPEGVYEFGALAPGAYVVTTAAAMTSFHYSFDTDGAKDWIVAVQLPPDSVGIARFAGISTEALTGTIDVASLGGAPTVACTWHGADGVLGSADDQTLDVAVDATGHFQVTGVPHGQYNCSAGASALQLNSQLPSAETTPTTVGPESPWPSDAVLPSTGGGSRTPAGLATLAVAAGFGLLLAGRRRPGTPH